MLRAETSEVKDMQANVEEKQQIGEWLRCMSWEVQQRASMEPSYFDPACCYIRRPARAECLHGADCRQHSAWHWHQFDHPSNHPLLLSPPVACPSWRLGDLQVCRHHIKSGSCRANSADGNCRFEHVDCTNAGAIPAQKGEAPAKTTSPKTIAKADAKALQRQHGQDWASGRAPRKKRSAYGPTACFRRFLLDTFGLDTLQGGSGVADVAGGAGTLSYELQNLNNIPSTVYDPRQPCFKRGKKSVSHRRRQAETGNRALSYDTAAARGDELIEKEQLPAWAEVWFGRWLWEECEEANDDGIFKASSNKKDAKEVNRWHNATTDDERLVALDPDDVSRNLNDCSVVLGLHPDGATDAIVDFALAKGKPFAILPCCVYNKHFTSRQTAAGRPVRTHTELVDYLQAKHSGIQRVVLDCDGRNVCLFWKGNAK